MANSLPSQQQLVTDIIDSLAKTSPSHSSSSETNNEESASNRRKLLLTLHVAFPNYLLPALDLLDRDLVTQIKAVEDNLGDGQDDEASNQGPRIHVVRSLGSTIKHSRAEVHSKAYLVSLDAWNCSCEGFALDVFANGAHVQQNARTSDRRTSMAFGGQQTTLQNGGEGLPCCKHLLACLLATKWKRVFGSHVTYKSCTSKELAGIVAAF